MIHIVLYNPSFMFLKRHNYVKSTIETTGKEPRLLLQFSVGKILFILDIAMKLLLN